MSEMVIDVYDFDAALDAADERGREAERAAIVAWLRTERGGHESAYWANQYADAIESGVHLPMGEGR